MHKHVNASVGLFFLCVYALFAGGHYGGDGFWSYLTAQSLVLDGDVVLGDRPFLVKEMVNQYAETAGEGVTSALGKKHSMYGLGLALLEIPFFTIGHLLSIVFAGVPSDYLTMFAVSMTNVVISSVSCVVFFAMGRALGFGRKRILWITGFFGLGSIAFPYASYGFSEPLLLACFLGTAYALLMYRRQGRNAFVVVAGILLGLAVLTKLYAVIVIPPFAVYLIFSVKDRSRSSLFEPILALCIPLVFFGGLAAWYNFARYGNPFLTGYHLVDFSRIGGFFHFSPIRILSGVYGLLLSSGRGLILFTPVTLLVPLAIWKSLHANRSEALLFSCLILEHLLFFGAYGIWHGGSSWGPRFLLPVVPFMLLPIGFLLDPPGPVSKVAKTLGVSGFLVQLPVVVTNYHLFIRFLTDTKPGFYLQPESQLFSPYLSPIIGAYYQVASAVSEFITGHGLPYPVPPTVNGMFSDLSAYDQIDLWWLNVLGSGYIGSGASACCIIVVLFLAVGATISCVRVVRRA